MSLHRLTHLIIGVPDLDEAATGVVQSAFGYQGQKCSACSRAIIDARVYDPMIEKIAERTAKIMLGDPTDNANNNDSNSSNDAGKARDADVKRPPTRDAW